MSHQSPNQTNLQRWLALALLSVEVGAIGFLSQTYVIPVVVVAIGFFGALSNVRVTLTQQRMYDAIALVAIVYILNYIFLPENPRYQQLFASQQIAFNIALFSLTIQALVFYIKRKVDFLPFMYPALGVVALACSAIVDVTPTQRLVFQVMCVLFALTTVLFCQASRRYVDQGPRRLLGRRIMLTIALAAVGLVGWYSATYLHRYEHQMDRFVRRFLQPGTNDATIGFSDRARLGSLSLQKDTNSMGIALRVVSPVIPGYLRGRAFDVYEDREWLMLATGRSLSPLTGPPNGIENSLRVGSYFEVGSLQGGLNRFEVWPALGGDYFAPLGSSYLHAASTLVAIDSHGILRSDSAASGVPYSVYAEGSGFGREETRVTDTDRDERLAAFPNWAKQSTELQQLVNRLFRNTQTTTQKIDAVKSFFRDNFRYSLQVSLPEGYSDDPLKWFLLAKPAAHCEYFASGTALLLRMGGVRCRYVTGFVVEELNDFSGDWVARNKDAHAWVEAFDEARGWVTVESTPSEGVPSSSQMGTADQFGEYLKDRLQRLRSDWRQYGVRLVGQFFIAFVKHPAGTFVVVALVALLGRRVYRNRKSRLPKQTMQPLPADVLSLNKLLLGIERQLKRQTDARSPSETLVQFADRLDSTATSASLSEAATWLRHYSAVRYQRERNTSDIEQLEIQAQTLIKDLRRKPAL